MVGPNSVDDVLVEQARAVNAEVADVGDDGRVCEEMANRDLRCDTGQRLHVPGNQVVITGVPVRRASSRPLRWWFRLNSRELKNPCACRNAMVGPYLLSVGSVTERVRGVRDLRRCPPALSGRSATARRRKALE